MMPRFNLAAPGNGATTLLFAAGRPGRSVPDQHRTIMNGPRVFLSWPACAVGLVARVASLAASKRRAESLGCASAVTSICLSAYV